MQQMMISHSENHIKQMRLNKGLKVEELAEQTGISKHTIYAIEENRIIPKSKTAYKLAVFFNCSMDDILRPFFKEDQL